MPDRFLKACRRQPVDCTPVWLMRQAGRYLREYSKIRSKTTFLTMCRTPELAAEVTILPVDKLGVDAAILFSDILLPVEAMGIELEFAEGKGPIIHNPIRDRLSVDALVVMEPEEEVPFVMETIRIVRRHLEGRVPLIGFSGAPFTLASYLVEGGHSRNYIYTKSMIFQEPLTYHALMDKLTKVVISYLNAQIRAGVQAIQIFDTWVECLSPGDYREYVMPYTKRVIDGLNPGTGNEYVPLIHYARGGAMLLESMKEAGGDVIGIDWRIDLDVAWERLGYDVAIQGNLDPTVLFAPPEEIERRVKDILNRVGNRPGHIFNLGHGVLPQTPVEHVIFMVEAVHKHSKRR
ncbi:MAG: uroporphyrinogen decarboxylase [Actinomycetota bacterium]|nr:uroporphyrinogen decarboxylase [Actinomycetota bacterium]